MITACRRAIAYMLPGIWCGSGGEGEAVDGDAHAGATGGTAPGLRRRRGWRLAGRRVRQTPNLRLGRRQRHPTVVFVAGEVVVCVRVSVGVRVVAVVVVVALPVILVHVVRVVQVLQVVFGLHVEHRVCTPTVLHVRSKLVQGYIC